MPQTKAQKLAELKADRAHHMGLRAQLTTRAKSLKGAGKADQAEAALSAAGTEQTIIDHLNDQIRRVERAADDATF
jgi:hypothetical protein